MTVCQLGNKLDHWCVDLVFRGIEWCSLHTFISYASSTANTYGLVKNDIALTDIQSGKSTQIRLHREEESPIEVVRVSHLK